MSTVFNADEVLAMAEEIARNGRKFYERGVGLCRGSRSHQTLHNLAVSWKQHERHFSSVREDLTEGEKSPTTYDPEGEAELYLQTMADTNVFSVKEKFEDLLTCDLSLADTLDKALSFEKDAILFFTGMARLVPRRFGKDVIEGIIDEEMRHVADLRKEVKALRKH